MTPLWLFPWAFDIWTFSWSNSHPARGQKWCLRLFPVLHNWTSPLRIISRVISVLFKNWRLFLYSNAIPTMLGYVAFRCCDLLAGVNINGPLFASPGQTIATFRRDISQHCWAQHVACVWPPCCDMRGPPRGGGCMFPCSLEKIGVSPLFPKNKLRCSLNSLLSGSPVPGNSTACSLDLQKYSLLVSPN